MLLWMFSLQGGKSDEEDYPRLLRHEGPCPSPCLSHPDKEENKFHAVGLEVPPPHPIRKVLKAHSGLTFESPL